MGAPIEMPRAMVTPIRNMPDCKGSVQMSAVGAPAQVTPSNVCALAVLTLTTPWPQTVMTRFFGFGGSGSTNVDQKSSVTPLTTCSSSRESYGAFFLLYGFGRSAYEESSTPLLLGAFGFEKSQLKPCSSLSAQSMIAWHVWNRS